MVSLKEPGIGMVPRGMAKYAIFNLRRVLGLGYVNCAVLVLPNRANWPVLDVSGWVWSVMCG